jgi:hypothetical protein
MSEGKALAVTSNTSNVDLYRASTDAANLCKAIVIETALVIQDRKYVRVEGWQAIAVAHGCTASARAVERIDGGVRAIGEIRRMSDGAVIAEAEGFVGEDEPTWYGGIVEKDEWVGPKGNRRKTGNKIQTTLPRRPDYAIRAMAQTRAISRACRSAFAHVVVMMNAGLSTTPAEEVPDGGFVDAEYTENKAEAKSDTNAPRQEDQAPPTSAALRLSLAQVAKHLTPSALGDWWNEQKADLRELMDDPDYAALIQAVKDRKTALETANQNNPFEDAA